MELFSPRKKKDESKLNTDALKMSKHVRWKEIDASCRVLLNSPGEDEGKDGVPLDVEDSHVEKNTPTGCFAFCMQFLGFIKQLVAPFPAGKREISVYIWKFTRKKEGLQDELANLKLWNRRLFFLREHSHEGRTLHYISEKENCSLHLVCTVHSEKKSEVSIQEMPVVDICALDEIECQSLLNDMATYDIAFGDESRASNAYDVEDLHQMSDYKSEVPAQLFPWKIRWTAAGGVEKSAVLANTSETQRARWLRLLVQDQPIDPDD